MSDWSKHEGTPYTFGVAFCAARVWIVWISHGTFQRAVSDPAFTVSNSQWIGLARSICGFAGSPQAWRSERGGRIGCEPVKEAVIGRAKMTDMPEQTDAFGIDPPSRATPGQQ
ncbi:hypothetical protein ACIA98_43105 [Streptomyces sp. NPDC051366]|uniref:hypothetical protein n=1 Tax=Streptomyces sp. NPDC051366 TaxID=3365652 RepID=UPI00378EB8CC